MKKNIDVNIQLTKMYNEMDLMAVSEVERLAREVLRKNKSLHEFIMAMGTYFFTTKEGEHVDIIDSIHTKNGYRYEIARPSFKPLVDFMRDWDEIFGITGNAMRFTVDGEKITDW